MKLETVKVGDRFFEAALLRNGRDVDNCVGDRFSTRAEAEADGADLAASYDPEWQKRNPGAVEHFVREWQCDSVDDGISAHVID